MTVESRVDTQRPLQVLLVDDDELFSELTTEYLSREDDQFELETATNVDDALDRLEESTFDCIVSDFDMPGRNGLEFLEVVRAEDPSLPFILFTSKGSEEVAGDAITAGVSDYLQKGSGAEQFSLLATRISNLASQYHGQRRLHSHAHQQRRLAALSQEALSGARCEELFDIAVHLLTETLDVEFAKVLEYRADHDDLLLRSNVGFTVASDDVTLVAAGSDSQAGHTLRSQEPIVVDDLRSEDRFWGPALLTDHDVVSGISVIIGTPTEPWGVLGIHSTSKTRFTDQHIDFVQTVANILANAIQQQDRKTELRQAREWYQRVVSHLPNHVVIVDEAGIITYCSSGVERQTGFTPEEMVGTNAFDYLHPEDRIPVSAQYIDALGKGEINVEHRSLTKDGSYRWFNVRGGVYLDDPIIGGILMSVTEIQRRKEKEQELERFKTIVETIDDVAFVVDRDLTIQYLNPAVYDYQEAERTEVYGSSIIDTTALFAQDPADVARLEAAFDQIFDPATSSDAADSSPSPERLELTLAFEQGPTVFEYQLSPVLDGEEVTAVVVTMRDTTERIKHEQTITALHHVAKQIFQATDTEEVAEIVVAAIEEGLGLLNNCVSIYDEAIGGLRTVALSENAKALFSSPPIFRPGESLAWDVFESGTPVCYNDVSTVPGRMNPDTQIRSEMIVPIGDFGVVTVGSKQPSRFSEDDVSLVKTLTTHAETALERLDRQQALERSEELYRSLTVDVMDTSGVGTFVLDEDLTVVWADKAIETFFGIDRTEIIGMDKRVLIHDHLQHLVEDTEMAVAQVLESYELNSQVAEFECHINETETTEDRWLKHWSHPITTGLYAGGRVEHYTDISNQIKKEAELQRQNELLENFAQVVSHDLRNPLNIAQGRVALAREDGAAEHFEAVERAHDRMYSLIENLLSGALYGGGIDDDHPLSLTAVTDRCWETVDTAGAALHVETDCSIYADYDRIQHLFENLFRNSIEHGGDDLTVTVGALDDGFYVADNGPGIPEADRRKVFDSGYSTRAGGSGLGLWIVKQVAAEHGWTVDLTASTDGGVRFEFTGVDTYDDADSSNGVKTQGA